MAKVYRFEVDGTIPSKKNSLRGYLCPSVATFINSNKHRNIALKELSKFVRVRPSTDYEKWEAQITTELMRASKGNLFLDNVETQFDIYFPRKGKSGGDLDNKKTSLLDAMVKANIIADDHYEVVKRSLEVGHYRKGHGGAVIHVKDLDS